MLESLKTISPVDGSLYVERAYTSPAKIEEMLSAARAAQQEWRQKSVADRAAILEKCVDNFVARKDVIAEELAWQMGRPVRFGAGE
ncbi:MAG: aldehyde dehydrogenase family protein, partial [Sneathiella sp.]